jgi:hypothetical protein
LGSAMATWRPAVLALSTFAAGSFLGLRMATLRSQESGWWPPRMSVLLSLVAIAEAGFLVAWMTTAGHPSTAMADVLIVSFDVAMGLQTAAVRSLGVLGIFTTAGRRTALRARAQPRPRVATRDHGRRDPDGSRAAVTAFMLRRTYDVHVELPMQATIVLVAALGESAATLRRVAGDVEETVARLRRPEVTSPIAAARGMFADAPGVPTLLPGVADLA